jgi:hypothetical protein
MQRARSVRENDGSSSTPKQELTEAELQIPPVTDLISHAEAAGINLTVEGDQLRIRGPRKAEALGRLLLERKAEVLAVLVASSQPKAETSERTDGARWNGTHAAAIVAEVDAQIAAALLTASLANKPARRNVLANEQQIVRELAHCRDPFLWEWPHALGRLLRRWQDQDTKGNRRTG